MKNRTILFTFILLIASFSISLGNAAQPGVWNAGGTVFTMLYPEDSLSFKKVQMENEKLFIHIYNGFAVVKGEYNFKNTTSDTLEFRMGYPVNGIYAGGSNEINEVYLDSLSQFRISRNGTELPLTKTPHSDYGQIMSFSDNWFVWDMIFLPQERQTIEVFFLVNTNEAQIRKGYQTERKNAFIYLLESGSVWKQPIRKGEFLIAFKDLELSSVAGLSAGFPFRANEQKNMLYGEFTNLSPTIEDNLVITYSQENSDFDFETIVDNSTSYYRDIQEFSQQNYSALNFEPIEFGSPYEVNGNLFNSPFGLILVFLLGVVLTVAGLLAFFIFRRKRSHK